MADALNHCWVCGSSDTVPERSSSLDGALSPNDLRITDKSYGITLALRRCRRCRFLFADAGDLDKLTALYAAMDDTDYVATAPARLLQMQYLIKQIRRECPSGVTLLDVGAGIGILVAAAREEGLDAVGIEPSTPLTSRALPAAAGRLVAGALPHPSLEGQRFDLVTLIDVVEHVSDPVSLLRACAGQLADDGLLVVVTPDVESVAARALGRRWWHYRPAHVGYFSRDTLRMATQAAGLEQILVARPRWYLPPGYLANRLAVYAPQSMRGLLTRITAPFRPLANMPVAVDLRDSLLVYLRQARTS